MFEVFRFECAHQLKSPLFLIISFFFFLLAFMLMASEQVSLGGVSRQLNLNAAWTIVFTQFFFSIIGMLAAISIVSQSITRDYELKTAEILFSTGISERQFLFGRFAAGCLFGMLVGVAALFGTLLATFMPWLDQERLGAFDWQPYVYALGVVTLPNFYIASGLFYAVAALTRSMMAAFSAALGFFVINILVSALADPEQIQIYALLDPFGGTAFSEVSRYWTVFERNSQLVPLEGNLLWNRILWVSLATAALVFTGWRYRFDVNPGAFFRRKKKALDPAPEFVGAPQQVTLRAGRQALWAQLRAQLRADFSGVFKTVPFYAIMVFALINIWGGFQFATSSFGIPLMPTTSAILRVIAGSYSLFLLMIIIFYAGELIHRERQTRVAEVLDAMPFPSGILLASKTLCLLLVLFALYAIAIVAGVIAQSTNGYYNFEFALYLKGLFLVQGSFFYGLIVLAVFVQALSSNKWLGMAVMLVLFIAFASMGSFGFEHALYNFGVPGQSVPHSDMNGFGHYVPVLSHLAVYWGALCGAMLVCAHLFFTRGVAEGFTQRLAFARQRASSGAVSMGVVCLLVFAASGSWLYYNMNIVNEYVTQDDVEALQADYEKTYKQYELADQLEPVSVDVEVDIFPNERRLESRGTIVLANVNERAVDELFLSTHARLKVNQFVIPGAERFDYVEDMGVHRYRFAEPIPPGGQITVRYDATWHHKGIESTNARTTLGAFDRLVANGTFVNNTEIMPTLGYNRGFQIGDPNTRREYDLPAIERLPKLNDPDWLFRSQLGFSRRTAFRARVSTAADQIAVAPGYLVGEVEEANGRRTYTYEMDEPIWPFFSFMSARYEVARDTWNDVAIEVYYHPRHNYNIEPMLRGTKKSLDYFTQAFSPYQYRQFRILEFPRYASFAQAFPNTIPFSEAIGFVADLRHEHDLDLVFYVTAHEMAHQWWAHQVIGAQMQGMTVIVETLAQYSALMVMEREYGKDKMRRFLRYELDQYLQGRGGELVEELPLMLSENQPYIHYRKGSLVMYALKDQIGEDKVNLALRNFIADFAFIDGPFPTAQQLVQAFRDVASDEHQQLITDLFENITLYDLRVADTEVKEVEGKWQVSFATEVRKYYADGQGQEVETEVNDWVDVAVFPEDPEDLQEYQLPAPLFMEKRKVNGDGRVVVTVDTKPYRVGIDPYNKLIDRNPEDNLKTL